MTQLDRIASQSHPAPGPGLFLRSFVSSAVLLVAIKAIEPVFFGEGHFATLTYHPFWIVILLAAVQHGLFVGLSIVGLAAMIMDWPSRPVGTDITEHYVDIATAPAQWLIAALLIGLYRQQQIRHERALARDNDRLREINQTLAGEIHRLDAFVARAELAAATRISQRAGDAPENRSAMADRSADAGSGHLVSASTTTDQDCFPETVVLPGVVETDRMTPAAAKDDDKAAHGTLVDLPTPDFVQFPSTLPPQGDDAGADADVPRCTPSDDRIEDRLSAPVSAQGLRNSAPGLNSLGRALETKRRSNPDNPRTPSATLAHA